jgi:hypothetical protein
MSGQPPATSFTLQAVLPTSTDPRVASENFTAQRLAAIVTISGRLVAPMSRHPEEHEIALLPGTLLLPVGSVTVDGLINDVVLLSETGTAPGLPADSGELRRTVTQQVMDALRQAAVTVYSPGRFTPSVSIR